MLDFDNLVFAGIGAAFDQARDRPGEWGQGFGAFSERSASLVGQYLVQRGIIYPGQAFDVKIQGDAFMHTIWPRDDSGGMMPAYSEVLGDGAAAVSSMWWPDQYHKGSAIGVAGSDTFFNGRWDECFS